jgi:two-component system sensor histidine kinase ChvG
MLDAYADSFAGRQVRLDARLQTNVVVNADEELLEVVFENVIDNALSISPAYGAVTVELTTHDKRAHLAVRDQGPGVPAPHLDRIFERYVSLRGAFAPPVAAVGQGALEPPSDSSPHLGIGLWIVRRNLEAVGGSARAENRQRGGLSLVMDLPLAA